MQALVVYHSKFGSTRQIAQAVGEVLAERYLVQVLPVEEAAPLQVGTDLLVVGGPTHAHGASAEMKAWLNTVERGMLNGVPAAVFDTRFQLPRWLSGAAAGVIAKRIERAGCELVLPPESFFVAREQEAGLLPGELERARGWVRLLLAALPTEVGAAARR